MFDGYAIRSINIDQLLTARDKKLYKFPGAINILSIRSPAVCWPVRMLMHRLFLFLTFFSSTYFTFIQIYSLIFVKLHSDSLDNKLIRVWICATTLPMRNVILALCIFSSAWR